MTAPRPDLCRMDRALGLTALFSFLVPAVMVGVEPSGQGLAPAVPSASRGFTWDWVLVLPPREFGAGPWRDWVSEAPGHGKGRLRGLPGATVIVYDQFLDERKDRFVALNAAWAPVLARSFQMGWQSPYTAQMLSEFMTMSGVNFHPPTIPSVWYNALIPYWVQQGWRSPLGVQVGASGDRPIMLYPGRR